MKPVFPLEFKHTMNSLNILRWMTSHIRRVSGIFKQNFWLLDVIDSSIVSGSYSHSYIPLENFILNSVVDCTKFPIMMAVNYNRWNRLKLAENLVVINCICLTWINPIFGHFFISIIIFAVFDSNSWIVQWRWGIERWISI